MLFVSILVAGPLMAQSDLTFEALQSRAKPDPTQLRAEADLATLQRELATTGGIFREGPTVAVEAGRRVTSAGNSTDKAAQVDAPLLLAPGVRRTARQTLEASTRTSLVLLKAESRQRLRMAYLEAWSTQAQLRVRESQVLATEAWLRVAQARVASGSDPAFQVDLVMGDQYRQRAELGEAHRLASEAWAHLRGLADLPLEPLSLAGPGPAVLPDPATQTEAFEQSLMRRAVVERLAREQSHFELQQALRGARWSLRGSHASEGDETVTRFGIAFRLPRPGEAKALRSEASAVRRALDRERESTILQLESRFQTALARLRTFGAVPLPLAFEGALAAVDLRFREGKERPSDALLLRRQVLEAQIASLQRLRDAHALLAELEVMTLGDPS